MNGSPRRLLSREVSGWRPNKPQHLNIVYEGQGWGLLVLDVVGNCRGSATPNAHFKL